MSRKRSIRLKKKKAKKGNLDLDITSLLDILVILLIFLIKSYNSSGVTLNVPKGIELPESKSDTINTPGVIIQVSRDTIWVDSKVILDTTSQSRSSFDQSGRRIIALFNELVKKKNEIKNLGKQSDKIKKFSGVANLIVDKSLKYSYLKKVMYTAAAAGFKEYKFVVLGQE